jgi:hypothetical protein
MIYAVHFAVNQLEKFINDNKTVCVPVFNISECTVPTEDGKLEYKYLNQLWFIISLKIKYIF